MKSKLKAFTLLELIIVMTITAALMGLGVSTLINYRSSVQLGSAYTDTVSAIKLMQNKATNSTSVQVGGTVSTPDIYSLRINSSSITPYYCNYGSTNAIASCTPLDFTTISSYQTTYNVNVTSTCSGFGFTRLTNDAVKIDSSAYSTAGAIDSSGTCVITLTQSQTNDQKQITIDVTGNTINL